MQQFEPEIQGSDDIEYNYNSRHFNNIYVGLLHNINTTLSVSKYKTYFGEIDFIQYIRYISDFYNCFSQIILICVPKLSYIGNIILF